MTAWPASLPQSPRAGSLQRVTRDNVIRSRVGYGPDRLRRRTATVEHRISFNMVMSRAQLATLDTFYETTTKGTGNIDWVDHLSSSSPLPAAVYKFVGPPEVSHIEADNWLVGLILEQRS